MSPDRRHGDVTTPPNREPAPCRPSATGNRCSRCARHNLSLPADPMRRPMTVMIDASVLERVAGPCPMYAPKQRRRSAFVAAAWAVPA